MFAYFSHLDPSNKFTSPKYFDPDYIEMNTKPFFQIAFSFILSSGYMIAVSLISPNVVRFLHNQMVDSPLSDQDFVSVYLITTILFLMGYSFAILLWYDHSMKKLSTDYS